MKTLIKPFALAALLAGTAFAGPSNPADSFAGNVNVTTAAPAGCPMIRNTAAFVPNAGRTAGTAEKVTAYRHEGCTGADIKNLSCKGSTVSCQAMRHQG